MKIRSFIGLAPFIAFFVGTQVLGESKPTWSLNYDSKPSIRTADWQNYLQLPFNASQTQTSLFSAVNTNVKAFDYGLYNSNLGGGHIARAAQHALTYGNYLVGRQCLEEAIKDYLTANAITVAPDKYFYQQGFWPMRNAGIISSDAQLTKVSKALKSLHGGDLVYSKISSNGPENGAEVVTLNCTVCHEARALVPVCSAPGCVTSNTNLKAVRSPWGAEGYISKNMKLMAKAVQDAVAKAASGHSCASGPEKYIFAAMYELQKAKHQSVNPNGTSAYVDLDPRRMLSLTPDSSFYNPAGQVAHTALNLLVNKGSWYGGKPTSVDQAFQMFRPEDVLTNNQFYGILNANFNQLYGMNRNGSPAPVNFSLNSAWSEKFYAPMDNMFHGMGCTYTDTNGVTHLTNCGIQEKAIMLAAATNSQGLNPDLSNETLNRFPGVPYDYKWPLRKYSGPDGVFERTSELFIGIGSNGGNPAVNDIINKRAMTYESVLNGINTYNQRCADCHGTSEIPSAIRPHSYEFKMPLNPGSTDALKFVTGTRDMPARAYIANLRNQPYVQEDALRDLAMKEFDGYRGDMFYGLPPAPQKLLVKNLVGIAMEQRFGCYLNMTEFLQRAVPKPIQVTSSTLDVTNLGFVKTAQYVHTAANETTAANNYPGYLIYWQKEHPECGPLTTAGASQPTQFYDHAFHANRLDGTNSNYPKLTTTQIKEMIDFFIAISFENTVLPSTYGQPITLRLAIPQEGLIVGGSMDGSACDRTCAKFGDSCNTTFESSSPVGRKCCAEVSEKSYMGDRRTLRCTASAGTTSGSWGYCEYDAECLRASPTGEVWVCRNKQCVAPPSMPSPSPSPSPTGPQCLPSGGACTMDSQCCNQYCRYGMGTCM